MQAMILAAGFGTRLLPYTSYLPKPLFPLLNIPLLLLTINRLKRGGFDHIIVNCHHLQEKIVDHISHLPGVVVQREKEILGTGGGLGRAFQLMRHDEPLLVTNGDIYHDIDLVALYAEKFSTESPVILAIHDYPRFNTLCVKNDTLSGFESHEEGQGAAFTGIHVIDPGVVASISGEAPSCILDRYRQMLASGEEIDVVPVDGCYWRDMGTPQDYLLLHGDLLSGRAPLWPEFNATGTSNPLIDERAECGEQLEIVDWCCIGKARVGRNVVLKRVVVWDGAVIPEGSVIEDCIVTP